MAVVVMRAEQKADQEQVRLSLPSPASGAHFASPCPEFNTECPRESKWIWWSFPSYQTLPICMLVGAHLLSHHLGVALLEALAGVKVGHPTPL